MSNFKFVTATLLASTIGTFATTGESAVVYDESIHGDLSGDRLAPTHVSLLAGANSLLATTATTLVGEDLISDQEYLQIDLPADQVLTAIHLQAFDSIDSTAFIGVQHGTTFSFDPEDAFANIGNLLGWSHFGPGVNHEIGDDILTSIAAGQGAIGFTPPLAGTSYTFWLQQTGDETSYQLDFVVAPEPAAWQILACGIVVSIALARRLSKRTRQRRLARWR